MGKDIQDKLRGGFYTPKIVADFLIDWAQLDNQSTIIETSCGNGVFLSSICNKFFDLKLPKEEFKSRLVGIELVEKEANEAKKVLENKGIPDAQKIIINCDFFDYCLLALKSNTRYSIITGNPPFIRYQDFPKKSKDVAFSLIDDFFDFKLSRHANSWIAFLLLATRLLKDNGKLAMVIPAQLFQVNYARDTRKFLSTFFDKLTIICFEKLIFPGAEQEVVLLMGERNDGEIEGIRVIELRDENDLYLRVKPEDVSKNFTHYKYKPMDHSNEKWTQYFLNTEEIELLRKISTIDSVKRGQDLYSVDIGVVTGKNKYFLFSNKTLNLNKIDKGFTRDIVCKSSDLQGITFSASDLAKIEENGHPCYLLTPPDTCFEDLPTSMKEYIKRGVELGVNKGFKCRIRGEEWYHVPAIHKPQGFMLRQIHDYPKIVLNESESTCTDTIHRVTFKTKLDREKITTAFINSLTFACSEVKGRSYGGGVLTLEPSEAEYLLIPVIGMDKLNFVDADSLLRSGDIKKFADLLDKNDEILLRDGLDLRDQDVATLRNIWIKLRNRRKNRKRLF